MKDKDLIDEFRGNKLQAEAVEKILKLDAEGKQPSEALLRRAAGIPNPKNKKKSKEDEKPKDPRGGYRGTVGFVKDYEVAEKDPENSLRIKFFMELADLPVVDTSDIPALENRFIEYLAICEKHGRKPGNQACYFALGLDKDTMEGWANGSRGTSQHQVFGKKIKQFLGMTREELMASNKINPVTGIFWQKNYDGLRDQQEVVVTPNYQQADPVELVREANLLPDVEDK